MSAELWEYVRVMGETVFDLIIGYGSGGIIDMPFNRSDLRPIGNTEQFWKVFSLVLLEGIVTATSMIGLRRLMYADDGEHILTGGLFYLYALMASQQGFILNSRALWEYLTGLIKKPAPHSVADEDFEDDQYSSSTSTTY